MYVCRIGRRSRHGGAMRTWCGCLELDASAWLCFGRRTRFCRSPLFYINAFVDFSLAHLYIALSSVNLVYVAPRWSSYYRTGLPFLRSAIDSAVNGWKEARERHGTTAIIQSLPWKPEGANPSAVRRELSPWSLPAKDNHGQLPSLTAGSSPTLD